MKIILIPKNLPRIAESNFKSLTSLKRVGFRRYHLPRDSNQC